LLYGLKTMPLWFSPSCSCLAAKGGERVVENPQKILRNKHAVKIFSNNGTRITFLKMLHVTI
ncbi:MAG TPA: hypothetical protein VGQ53_04085, partial [Chitinophagaceae bacterium]|nr:hypothetical protein [Chitinophagaceae bacterium]